MHLVTVMHIRVLVDNKCKYTVYMQCVMCRPQDRTYHLHIFLTGIHQFLLMGLWDGYEDNGPWILTINLYGVLLGDVDILIRVVEGPGIHYILNICMVKNNGVHAW